MWRPLGCGNLWVSLQITFRGTCRLHLQRRRNPGARNNISGKQQIVPQYGGRLTTWESGLEGGLRSGGRLTM